MYSWKPDFRFLVAAAVLAGILIFALIRTAEAHPPPKFYEPAGVVQDIPVGAIDQFHPEDHLAMLEHAVGGWTAAHTAALVEDLNLPAVMVRVAGAESCHRPDAHRTSTRRTRAQISGPLPTGDYGLFQINWGVWGTHLKKTGVIDNPADLFDPRTNGRAAVVVLEQQGLKAWNASRLRGCGGGWR